MPSAYIRHYTLIALISVVCFACKFNDPIKNKISFEPVKRINYIEVRRSFDSGLIFNKDGYQLAPIWKLMFYSDKWASVYSPDKDKFLNFAVTLDHDSIFNISGTWLKAMHISKDSLRFQVLKVEGKTVYYVKSNVYMTMYAENYIKNVLHKTIDEVRKPLRRDSLYLVKRTASVNVKPDSFFAARKPVQFISESPRATVIKKGVEADIMNKWDASDEYMFPEYTITIKKAYEDFSYSFWATVDTKGQIHYQKSLTYVYPEFVKSTDHTIKAIIDGYLKAYFQVIPGTTLDIPHNSAVALNVIGRKN
ncbi:hypothetical protein [Mucilaginibacter sp. UR6-11]|uniref:hypothetical protein n=1 Tax=Mucilaginibacter sp. UR6-11 TaxID=1435644 RepID=UPI001E2F1343|nr:hypothetical protein [Mucilaginibacter sp. UR6-11]MCC8425886.1 hypothetical protein [Mucilaginibacter sp. UR6-11]